MSWLEFVHNILIALLICGAASKIADSFVRILVENREEAEEEDCE